MSVIYNMNRPRNSVQRHNQEKKEHAGCDFPQVSPE